MSRTQVGKTEFSGADDMAPQKLLDQQKRLLYSGDCRELSVLLHLIVGLCYVLLRGEPLGRDLDLLFLQWRE